MTGSWAVIHREIATFASIDANRSLDYTVTRHQSSANQKAPDQNTTIHKINGKVFHQILQNTISHHFTISQFHHFTIPTRMDLTSTKAVVLVLLGLIKLVSGLAPLLLTKVGTM